MTTARVMAAGLAMALSLGFGEASAQQSPVVTFGGQVRPRFERRTPVDGSWSSFTSMRVRAQVAARIEENTRVFIQLQDVRLWGEEANTLGDFRADNFDLHQGYVELLALPGVGGALRIGRQELALGEQRLIGPVGWTQQGRSFDGLRYTTPSLGRLKVDVFGFMTRESASEAHDNDASVLGAYGTVELSNGSLDLLGILDSESADEETQEVTVGAIWRAGAGPFSFRVEGNLQTGEREGRDVSAYLVGARASGRISDEATVTLWFDQLSGDEDPDDTESRVFSTLYATNHLYYGLADLFLNIPTHTGGLGLRDVAVKLAVTPSPGTTLNLDLHKIQAAQQSTLSTTNFGNEIDLTVAHRISNSLTLQAGYSFVQVEDGLKELGRFSENVQWMYLMLNAAF